MERLLLSVCVVLLAASSYVDAATFPPMPKGDPLPSVKGLISRILGPSYVDKFTYEVVPDQDGADVFSVDGDTQDNKPVLRGNNGVALSSAFNYYLKYFCNCSISWGRNGTGDQLWLRSVLPMPKEKIRIVFPNRYRYYQNVCTVSYSMVWWDWARWEREIDWMAMNGLNFILSFTGQEYVWQKFYASLGLTDEEIKDFFSGPAFLAWQRMGNIRGWGGPLDDGWIKKQADLQKNIVQRIREFGMISILPGFAGHVPQAIERVFPTANLTKNAHWGGFTANYTGDYLLEPTDPLFSSLGKKFYDMLIVEFGNDHYFNADTYNEMNPSDSSPDFLRDTNAAIYNAMAAVDSEAVFVMQGWLFHSGFWNNSTIEPFLSGVPDDSMIILDLNSEQSPVWTSTNSYFGKPFIWCLLHNYGGTRGIYGDLYVIGSSPVAARNAKGSTMVGVGMTPEAIEHNPVVYDLMGEMSWRSEEVTDIMGWLDNYITRRYGNWTQETHDAWQLLLDGAYRFQWSWSLRSIVSRVPQLHMSSDTRLNPGKIGAAWTQIVYTAFSMGNDLDPSVGPLRYDIVDIGRQMLMNRFYDVFQLYSSTVQYYVESNEKSLITQVNRLETLLLNILTDLDDLLATDINFLVGNWLSDALKTAPDNASADVLALIQFNARNQITMWGPHENINDYAGKDWAGLVGTYYVGRWKIFFQSVSEYIQMDNKTFNISKYNDKRFEFEQAWDYQQTSFPTTPRYDINILASSFLHKYFLASFPVGTYYTMKIDRDVQGNELYGGPVALWSDSMNDIMWLCNMNPDCAGFSFPDVSFKSSVSSASIMISPGTLLFVKKH